MSRNIITNEGVKNLGERLKQLISFSKQVDILVGFFYFSGLDEIYEALKENKNLQKIRVLVGLGSDDLIAKLVKENEKDFLQVLREVVKTEEFDNEETFRKYKFYLDLIRDGKLIIRKTKEPNHAKLYLFHIDDKYKNLVESAFITGSSNFTKSGLKLQNEFNVEIKDWGFDYAYEYFEKLWESSEEITENETKREKIIQIIENSPVGVISPFLAYAYTIKNYIDTLKSTDKIKGLKYLFESKGYKPFSYQIDAVNQAIKVINSLGGIILADVVGLGKSVIASAIAHTLGERGIVIAPPHLVGDKVNGTGWYKYLKDFDLLSLGWEVFSLGKLEEVLKFVNSEKDIEVVIVDEAHRFRNENTKSYELLSAICRDKKVILLTATPFNNRPSDIFALLKLITPPKKSPLVVNQNLKEKFERYQKEFEKLSYILKYYKSHEKDKLKKAIKYYNELFGGKQVEVSQVKGRIKELANRIRSVISPVVIRRNRLDLKNHPVYSKEIKELPEVKDPQEVFYELTEDQSKFYDEILSYFEENGRFTGAIYKPIVYERGIENYENLKEDENFDFWIQKNLYDFMRRLLVRRLESSFGAFIDSIGNFKRIHKNVLRFITETGKYFLDRNLIENVVEGELDIEEALEKYERKVKERKLDEKFHKIYKVCEFKLKDKFIRDILNDIELFEEIEERMKQVELDQEENDPKANKLIELLKNLIKDRKVVIFTEFISTAEHLRKILEKYFKGKVLYAYGNLSKGTVEAIYENFDASYEKQKDDYLILLTTDKLSEGFNLNRAGAVINYDIPWNPVRVIQRIGRVNRIGKKVYDEIYIYNFFPTKKGEKETKQREIATQKLFMIHKILGEDSKILEPHEEPEASKLYKRLNLNPEKLEEESFETKMLKEWEEIKKKYPNLEEELKQFPNRIKTAKKGKESKVITFVRRGNIFLCVERKENDNIPVEKTLQEVFEDIKSEPEEKPLKLSENFWKNYKEIKDFIKGKIQALKSGAKSKDIENKALSKLKTCKEKLKDEELQKFIEFLEKEITEYGTLPEITLREISRMNTNSKDCKEVLENIKRKFYPSNYEKSFSKTDEIIVSFDIQKA